MTSAARTQVVFHYASGVSLSMLLSLLLLAYIIWARTGRRRPVGALMALLSFLGITATALREWAKDTAIELLKDHWP
jgi:hypothetical protein